MLSPAQGFYFERRLFCSHPYPLESQYHLGQLIVSKLYLLAKKIISFFLIVSKKKKKNAALRMLFVVNYNCIYENSKCGEFLFLL
jgi:hypothetical protein